MVVIHWGRSTTNRCDITVEKCRSSIVSYLFSFSVRFFLPRLVPFLHRLSILFLLFFCFGRRYRFSSFLPLFAITCSIFSSLSLSLSLSLIRLVSLLFCFSPPSPMASPFFICFSPPPSRVDRREIHLDASAGMVDAMSFFLKIETK